MPWSICLDVLLAICSWQMAERLIWAFGKFRARCFVKLLHAQKNCPTMWKCKTIAVLVNSEYSIHFFKRHFTRLSKAFLWYGYLHWVKACRKPRFLSGGERDILKLKWPWSWLWNMLVKCFLRAGVFFQPRASLNNTSNDKHLDGNCSTS